MSNINTWDNLLNLPDVPIPPSIQICQHQFNLYYVSKQILRPRAWCLGKCILKTIGGISCANVTATTALSYTEGGKSKTHKTKAVNCQT